MGFVNSFGAAAYPFAILCSLLLSSRFGRHFWKSHFSGWGRQVYVISGDIHLGWSFFDEFQCFGRAGFDAGLLPVRTTFFIPVGRIHTQVAFSRFILRGIPDCPVRFVRA